MQNYGAGQYDIADETTMQIIALGNTSLQVYERVVQDYGVDQYDIQVYETMVQDYGTVQYDISGI